MDHWLIQQCSSCVHIDNSPTLLFLIWRASSGHYYRTDAVVVVVQGTPSQQNNCHGGPVTKCGRLKSSICCRERQLFLNECFMQTQNWCLLDSSEATSTLVRCRKTRTGSHLWGRNAWWKRGGGQGNIKVSAMVLTGPTLRRASIILIFHPIFPPRTSGWYTWLSISVLPPQQSH